MTVAAPTPVIAAISPAGRAPAFADSHERIIEAGYRLFCRRAIRDVAMDEVVLASGVAKATLYRHFPTKDDLVLAILKRRETDWTFGIVDSGARSLSDQPEGRLLAIFDVFDGWFQRDDFEACTFVKVILEMGMDHPLGRASSAHLATIGTVVSGFAAEAGLTDPEEFARVWFILMKGCIVQAAAGDPRAARRARAMGELVIAANRAAVKG
ncbi:TetR/AcrR family transcriptional regulator [Glaciihabitans sp. INWT7]|uniref:TetR/AcrR family transcriptional regulator n=1 Tax=Glaciihabitans sp. INWT7 TaxID=2596912 RepID=UPI001623746E|nr:TetR/AcrR family transcriptional regulator [Glaciihabitans sp. INWT7]QNE47525.1 TetR/AcrR family transcriptional regulator [Glaciihabitans sp. INWT7]